MPTVEEKKKTPKVNTAEQSVKRREARYAHRDEDWGPGHGAGRRIRKPQTTSDSKEEEGVWDAIKSAGSGVLSSVKEAASGFADWAGLGNDKPSRDVPVREAVAARDKEKLRDKFSARTATHKYTPPATEMDESSGKGIGSSAPLKGKNLPPTEETKGVLSAGSEKFYADEAARRMDNTNMWKEARDNPRHQRSWLLNDDLYKAGIRTKEKWEQERKRDRRLKEYFAEKGRKGDAAEKAWAERTADARKTAAEGAEVYGKKRPPKKSQGNTSVYARNPPNTPRKTSKGALEAERLNEQLQREIY